jgi:hypothetical protein
MVRTGMLRWALASVVALAATAGQAQIVINLKQNPPPLPIDEATLNAVLDEALKRLEETTSSPRWRRRWPRPSASARRTSNTLR